MLVCNVNPFEEFSKMQMTTIKFVSKLKSIVREKIELQT